jgi:hypothetical protein
MLCKHKALLFSILFDDEEEKKMLNLIAKSTFDVKLRMNVATKA